MITQLKAITQNLILICQIFEIYVWKTCISPRLVSCVGATYLLWMHFDIFCVRVTDAMLNVNVICN